MELFSILDNKQDTVLDEAEFETIFNGAVESWNSHYFDIKESVLRQMGPANFGTITPVNENRMHFQCKTSIAKSIFPPD